MKFEIRFPESLWKSILEDIKKQKPNETISFAITKPVEASGRRVYIASRLIIPSEDEAFRSPGLVRPKEHLLRNFYTLMKVDSVMEAGYRTLMTHSHPFSSGPVGFSRTDHKSIEDDWKVISKVFGEDVETATIVLNDNGSFFDGYVYDKNGKHPIDRITIFGENLKTIYREKQEKPDPELFSRMLLIPDYDLDKVANLRVGITGLGGLGSSMLQEIVMLGIAECGELALVDFDSLELSNLARISFARHEDIGRAKVDVAKQYAESVRPKRKVNAIAKDCYSPEALEQLSVCDVIIGCVDSDAARKAMLYLSVNCGIPYLDISSGVLIDKLAGETLAMSGGQARLFVPGYTACLCCNLGLNHDQISREQLRRNMDDNSREQYRRAGYLKDIMDTGMPEPSCYNLNQIMSGLGASLLLGYILRGLDHDFISFSLEGLTILKGSGQSNELCPYCGDDTYFGNGELYEKTSEAPVPDMEEADAAD